MSPVEIFFQSSTGRVYTLQFKTNITATTWSNAPGRIDILGNGSLDSLTDPTPPSRRFYRINVDLP